MFKFNLFWFWTWRAAWIGVAPVGAGEILLLLLLLLPPPPVWLAGLIAPVGFVALARCSWVVGLWWGLLGRDPSSSRRRR